MDARHHEMRLDRPTAPVLDLARRLAGRWLALAGGGTLLLADEPPTWRPVEAHRDLGPMSEPWHGRSLEFDAHLSQLMAEPLGLLELIAPASEWTALERAP